MSFVLNDDEQMLRDSARGFLAETANVEALRALRDEKSPTGFSRELWSSLAEMGFCGVLVPEEHGGVDMGYAAAGLILEEMGRQLSASPFLATSVLSATALNLAGSESQKSEHLPKIASGEAVYAFAIDERARHNPGHIETRATKDGNGFTLSGSKRFVAAGAGADWLIVAARTDDDQINLFLVNPKSEGVTLTARRTVDSHVPADFTFDNVKLDGDAILSGADDAEKVYEQVLNAGRACQAAECHGVAAQAFDVTVAYIKEREQFGVPVASFQGLQHRAAHLYGELELSQSLVRRALTTLDTQPSQSPLCCKGQGDPGVPPIRC